MTKISEADSHLEYANALYGEGKLSAQVVIDLINSEYSCNLTRATIYLPFAYSLITTTSVAFGVYSAFDLNLNFLLYSLAIMLIIPLSMLIYKKSFPVESINVLWKQFPTRGGIVIFTINTLLLGVSIGTGVYINCNAHDDMNHHIAIAMFISALSVSIGITAYSGITAYLSKQKLKTPPRISLQSKDTTTPNQHYCFKGSNVRYGFMLRYHLSKLKNSLRISLQSKEITPPNQLTL